MFFIILAAGIFALDYALKGHVNDTIIQGTNKKIWKGRLVLHNCHNEGAAFGLLKNVDKKYCREASALALGGVIWEFLRQLLCGGRKLGKMGLSLVLGGGANNYYERRTGGAVTDYVSLGTGSGKLRSLVFNLSDIFVAAGAVLWAISALLPGGKNKKRSRTKDPSRSQAKKH